MKILSLLLLGLATQLGAAGYSLYRDEGGRHYFRDPAGKPWLMKACVAVIPKDPFLKPGAQGYDALQELRGDRRAWAKAAAERLRRYGFNGVGAWSEEAIYDEGLAFTPTLALAGYGKDALLGVWSPEFARRVEEAARKGCQALKGRPNLVGYFLDNELPWYGDTGWPGPHNKALIEKYLALPEGPDRKQARQALREYYKGAAPPAAGPYPLALQEAFAARVAERYFRLCAAALKRHDPGRLNLGVRFAGGAYDAVVKVCGRHVDLVSVNIYAKGGDFNFGVADRMHRLSGGKPLMVTEFSYRAMQNRSGNRNSAGADVTVPTQAERAARLKRFLGGALDAPYIVGYSWFQYYDQSPQGRDFDGEDSNYGLVDIRDREYEELRAAFQEINAAAEALHAKAAHAIPADILKSREPRLREIGSLTAPGGAQRLYLDFRDCDMQKVRLWNEASAKGEPRCAPGALRLAFDSGQQWGLGLGFIPAQADNQDGSANLLRYRRLRLKAKVPAGLSFSVYLNESGSGELSQADFSGVGGADGESWESPVFRGQGRPAEYSFRLDELLPRSAFGNQGGERVIDRQAVRSVDLYLPGKQGRGELEVESIRFEE